MNRRTFIKLLPAIPAGMKAAASVEWCDPVRGGIDPVGRHYNVIIEDDIASPDTSELHAYYAALRKEADRATGITPAMLGRS